MAVYHCFRVLAPKPKFIFSKIKACRIAYEKTGKPGAISVYVFSQECTNGRGCGFSHSCRNIRGYAFYI